MSHLGLRVVRRALTGYYAATAAFFVLDRAFGINLRIAFLDDHDGLRLAYYAVCVACFVAIVLKPGWTLAVSAVESLATMVALILSFWMQILPVDGALLEPGAPVVTIEQVINFVISGFAAWLAWTRSMTALTGRQMR